MHKKMYTVHVIFLSSWLISVIFCQETTVPSKKFTISPLLIKDKSDWYDCSEKVGNKPVCVLQKCITQYKQRQDGPKSCVGMKNLYQDLQNRNINPDSRNCYYLRRKESHIYASTSTHIVEQCVDNYSEVSDINVNQPICNLIGGNARPTHYYDYGIYECDNEKKTFKLKMCEIKPEVCVTVDVLNKELAKNPSIVDDFNSNRTHCYHFHFHKVFADGQLKEHEVDCGGYIKIDFNWRKKVEDATIKRADDVSRVMDDEKKPLIIKTPVEFDEADDDLNGVEYDDDREPVPYEPADIDF